VAGGWKRLHNKEFHNLYASPNIKSGRIRWTGYKAHGEMRNAYKILVRKPVGMRPFGRPRCRWEDNIVMDLQESGWEGVELNHSAQDRGQ
jgi:hypothetical protein